MSTENKIKILYSNNNEQIQIKWCSATGKVKVEPDGDWLLPESLNKYTCMLAVGNGDGNLFVYGDYESIKECQRKLLKSAPEDD